MSQSEGSNRTLVLAALILAGKVEGEVEEASSSP
jgi:hypothetical protein